MDKFKDIDIGKFDSLLAEYERFQDVCNGKDEQNVVARGKVCSVATGLFPLFIDDKNGAQLSSFELEQYGYGRSLGLSISDSAYSMGMSAERMYSYLAGESLSLESFVELIKQELFSRAECKNRLLRDIEQSSNKKNWRTSLTLLEKLYPNEYGARGGLEEKIDALAEKAWNINIVDSAVPATTVDVGEE